MRRSILFTLTLTLTLIAPTQTLAFDLPVRTIPLPSIRSFPAPSTDTPNPTQSPTPTPNPSAPQVTTVEISKVTPASANFMQEFIITGYNFGAKPGGVNFRYYTQNFLSGGAPIVSWSNNEIKAKVPAVKKGSYRIHVSTSDNKKSNEVRFVVLNGQPIVNSTSLRVRNGAYELIFEGTEFGSKRGEINIYQVGNIVAKGVIQYWSSLRVRFTLPNLTYASYGFQIQTQDGRQSSLKFFNVGN